MRTGGRPPRPAESPVGQDLLDDDSAQSGLESDGGDVFLNRIAVRPLGLNLGGGLGIGGLARLDSAGSSSEPYALSPPGVTSGSSGDTPRDGSPRAHSAPAGTRGRRVEAESRRTRGQANLVDGVLRLGGFTIRDTGLLPGTMLYSGRKDKPGAAEVRAPSLSPRPDARSPSAHERSKSEAALAPSVSFRDTCIRLDLLGEGASGVVYKVVHMPTLALMAAKMIPIADASKVHALEGELRALVGNASAFDGIPSPATEASRVVKETEARRNARSMRRAASRAVMSAAVTHDATGILPVARTTAVADQIAPSPFLVAFYDAFMDPDYRPLVFVTEYMDAGSLQDLFLPETSDGAGCGALSAVQPGEPPSARAGPEGATVSGAARADTPDAPPVPGSRAVSDERVLVKIAWACLHGLASLHAKRMIHRDIKPSNVLLSRRGGVKIADFGLMEQLEEGEEATLQVGTLRYMSPERIAGNAYGCNSDVWSLGMTLLALVLGRYPLPEPASYWTMLDITSRPILMPLPQMGANKVSALFLDLVRGMLTRDKVARPGTDDLLHHGIFARYGPWLQASCQSRQDNRTPRHFRATSEEAHAAPAVDRGAVDQLVRKMTWYWYVAALEHGLPSLPPVSFPAMQRMAEQEAWPLDVLVSSFLRAHEAAAARYEAVTEAAMDLARGSTKMSLV